MLRRVITNLVSRLKKLKMSDQSPALTGEKRQLDANDAETEAVKKAKRQDDNNLPMQGSLMRKRKVALLIAYCGEGYYGLQKQHGLRTIEADVVSALVKVEAIPPDHGETFSKMKFQRASRTDKGVSACGQVLSLKMVIKDDIIAKLNEQLPPQIRAIAYKRVTQCFDSKNYCDARTYLYMTPTYAFTPVEKYITDEYRVTDGIITHVNELLQLYKGTHNFHNFTSGVKSNDRSAYRFLRHLECGSPFVRDGAEFVIISLYGQSFMMHQIRKMLGLVIAIVRGVASVECVDRAWQTERIDIPKAPGLGLMLEKVHYDGYNKRYGNDGLHEPLEWSTYQADIDAFKEDHIMSNIINKEKHDKVMFKWLPSLLQHSFDIRPPGPPLFIAEQLVEDLRKEEKAANVNKSTSPTHTSADIGETQRENENPATTAIHTAVSNGVQHDTNASQTELVKEILDETVDAAVAMETSSLPTIPVNFLTDTISVKTDPDAVIGGVLTKDGTTDQRGNDDANISESGDNMTEIKSQNPVS